MTDKLVYFISLLLPLFILYIIIIFRLAAKHNAKVNTKINQLAWIRAKLKLPMTMDELLVNWDQPIKDIDGEIISDAIAPAKPSFAELNDMMRDMVKIYTLSHKNGKWRSL